ncbi:MAG: PfkB family carbohydrate kinase [Chloroflexota bacterium]
MIVVAGEALIDLLVDEDGALSAIPGGGPFNTARTIARLGSDVAFLGCLSDDRFGGTLRDALLADGVDLSLTATTDAPTTLAIAELDPGGAATYRFHTAGTSAAQLGAEAVEAAFATGPRAVHLGTLGLVLEPMASALAAGAAATSPETLVMLDPNCRPAVIRERVAYLDRLHRVLARADVVKVSADDLAYIDPGVRAVDAARAIRARGPAVVLLTDGGRPVTVVTADGTFEMAVPHVEVVDTVGAGDAFGGGFLARWIELGLGRPDLGDLAAVRDATAVAIEVAALTCERHGADPPRRADLRRSPLPS